MRKVIEAMICVLIVLTSVSCRKSMKPDKYMGYINNKENGLKKVSVVDGWEFSMQYRPYDYIMFIESKGNIREYNFNKRKAELNGTAWFNISIKRTDNSATPLRYGIASIEEYNARLGYYLNEADKDIKLLYGTDTLRPCSYLFENNYNLTPQETMVVGFLLPKGEDHPKKDMRISLVDRVFKNGIINAEYSAKTLENIPTLVY